MPPSIQIVDDVLDNAMKLMIVTIPPPRAVLKVREKTVNFCECLRFFEDDGLNDFAETKKKTDWTIGGGKLRRLSRFRYVDDPR